MAARLIPFKYGQVVADVPIMVEQWDFEKNIGVDITKLLVTTKDPAYFWTCKKCKFTWKSSVEARLYSTGKCPCCELNYYIVPGINDLLTVCKEAENVLDFEANAAMGIKIETFSASRQKIPIAWHCRKCGYKWNATVDSMKNSGFRCSCCETRRVIVKGVNDVFTLVRGLKDYYDFEKNGDFDIYSQGVSSVEKVHWLCPVCKRSWKTSICSRIKGKGGIYEVRECPHFNTTKRTAVHSVAETPEMFKFWDHDKNTINPADTPTNSPLPACWKCQTCGYEWQSSISTREQSSHRCPSCELKQRKVKNVSDLFTMIPESKLDYDFDKNIGINIESQGVRSKTPVWWKCHVCGYEWQSEIRGRVRGKKGSYSLSECSQCYHERKRNAKKVAEYPYLIKFWDFKKNKELGLDPNLTSSNSEQPVHWCCKKCGYEWEGQILARKRSRSDKCPCCDQNVRIKAGVNDVFTVVPELQRIYDFDLNEDIDITSEGVGSTQNVNFKCQICGRKWAASIADTVRKQPDGSYRVIGCRNCDNRKYRKISYAEQYPDLTNRFDSEKNGFPFTELERRKNASTDSYWWHCDTCGRSFEASIYRVLEAQTTRTKGCPICAKRVLVVGESFAERFPEHMDEYAPDNEIDPYSIFPTDKTRVRWICRNYPTHVWPSSFFSRSKGEGNCPYCADRMVLSGFNSVEAKHPAAAKKWSPSNEKTADQVLHCNKSNFLWICPDCQGEFSNTIDAVVNDEKACPYCADRMVLPGFNSFAARHEDLLKEWDYINNYLLADPDQISENCSLPVWWECVNDSRHKYYISPARRLEFQKRHREPCTYCKGLRRKKRHFV